MYGKYECFVMQMLYVCVLCHPVVVLNAEFGMTCRLLCLSRMPEATIWKRHTLELVS